MSSERVGREVGLVQLSVDRCESIPAGCGRSRMDRVTWWAALAFWLCVAAQNWHECR